MSETLQAEWTALLGRRDAPTDALRDYCEFLSAALGRRGISMPLVQVRWAERGWIRSWLELWRRAGHWKGCWVLLQYTALSWSRRGIPFPSIAVVAALRLRGARTAIVFHDSAAYAGTRVVDRVRRACQLWTMRCLASLADRNVFPAPIETVSWLPRAAANAAFIPIGANLPATANESCQTAGAGTPGANREARRVAIYGITGDAPGRREIAMIAAAMKRVSVSLPGVRLVVFGRGSEQHRADLERAIEGMPVELSVRGLLPAEEVARELRRADVLLFVRGELLGQRGSAIAAIACGTPIVGYGHPERAFPLSEAGIVFVPAGDLDALTCSLQRVLTNESLRLELHERNRRALAEYFSWDRIAARFAETLTGDERRQGQIPTNQ